MDKKTIIAGLFLLLGALLISANAAPGGEFNNRHRNQEQRIHQGKRSGAINHREMAQLQHQQAQIEHDKYIMKLDGRITRRERAYLRDEQAKASQNIYLKKHNGRHAHRN